MNISIKIYFSIADKFFGNNKNIQNMKDSCFKPFLRLITSVVLILHVFLKPIFGCTLNSIKLAINEIQSMNIFTVILISQI